MPSIRTSEEALFLRDSRFTFEAVPYGRRTFLSFVGGATGAYTLNTVGVPKATTSGVKIRLAGSSDAGEGGRRTKARAQEWAAKDSLTTESSRVFLGLCTAPGESAAAPNQ
jgi:hypothetical protein